MLVGLLRCPCATASRVCRSSEGRRRATKHKERLSRPSAHAHASAYPSFLHSHHRPHRLLSTSSSANTCRFRSITQAQIHATVFEFPRVSSLRGRARDRKCQASSSDREACAARERSSNSQALAPASSARKSSFRSLLLSLISHSHRASDAQAAGEEIEGSRGRRFARALTLYG